MLPSDFSHKTKKRNDPAASISVAISSAHAGSNSCVVLQLATYTVQDIADTLTHAVGPVPDHCFFSNHIQYCTLWSAFLET
jgi:hypothetical protein